LDNQRSRGHGGEDTGWADWTATRNEVTCLDRCAFGGLRLIGPHSRSDWVWVPQPSQTPCTGCSLCSIRPFDVDEARNVALRHSPCRCGRRWLETPNTGLRMGEKTCLNALGVGTSERSETMSKCTCQ